MNVSRGKSGLLACAFLFCAATLLAGVQGHGYMINPPSRNFLGSKEGGRTEPNIITYTPHGGNGKGKSSKHAMWQQLCSLIYYTMACTLQLQWLLCPRLAKKAKLGCQLAAV